MVGHMAINVHETAGEAPRLLDSASEPSDPGCTTAKPGRQTPASHKSGIRAPSQ